MQALFQLTQLRLLAVRASGLRDLTAQISVFTELRRLDVSRSRDLEVHEDILWGQHDLTAISGFERVPAPAGESP